MAKEVIVGIGIPLTMPKEECVGIDIGMFIPGGAAAVIKELRGLADARCGCSATARRSGTLLAVVWRLPK